MFPTSGYFRSIPCPFFSTGFCERPQCHFRHTKSEPEGATISNEWKSSLDDESAGSDQSQPYLLRFANQLVRRAEKEFAADKLKLGTDEGSEETQVGNEEYTVEDDIQMRDAILDDVELKVKVGGNKPKQQQQQQQQSAPEYTPTPIAKLKLLQLKQKIKSCNELPPRPLPKTPNLNVLEYDPTETCSNSIKSSVDYKPSPKIAPSNNASKSKSSASAKLISQNVAVNETDSDDDYNSGDHSAAFSEDDEVISQPKSKVKTVKEKESEVDSNFDVVKRIMNASSLCDSVISASSVKKFLKPKTTVKNEPNKQNVIISKKVKPTNSKSVKVSSKVVNNKSTKTNNESKNKIEVTNKLNKTSSVKKQGSTVDSSGKKNNSNQVKGTTNKKASETKASSKEPKKSTTKDVQKKQIKKESDSESGKKKVPSKSTTSEQQQQRTKTPTKSNVHCNGFSEPKTNLTSSTDTNNKIALESLFSDSEDDLDEHDTYEECLRIFNEYKSEQSENTTAKLEERKSSVDSDYQVVGKKRIAHDGAAGQAVKRVKVPINHHPSPSAIMQNRLIQSLQTCKENRELVQGSTDASGTKRRIAHVPCYQPVDAKKTLSVAGPSTHQPTSVQTVAKGATRIAHTPSQTLLKRPMIPAEFGCRVPVNIRQRYLNLIIDECLKMYDEEKDAFERAINEERSSYDRSCNRTIYLNSVAITIKKLRSEQSGQIPTTPAPAVSTVNKFTNMKTYGRQTAGAVARPPPPPQRLVSHEAILYGKKGVGLPLGLQKKKLKPWEEPLTGARLYKALKPYLLTKEKLIANGYPMSHPTDSHRAVIHKQPSTKNVCGANPLEKICARCGSSFEISSEGVYLTKSECFYHWGKVHKTRIAGSIEGKYSCCGERAHSAGCCVAELHVFEDSNNENLKGFVKTLPKSPPWDGNCGTFALDCEMSYTNKGVELVRVTVIGAELKPVYETLVKPENPIIDYNTRFSGISKKDLDNVVTTIRDVQAVLLSLFNDQTILIGHSLESDLKALKLIHGTVVDTSIVFPHRLGSPYKRALRNLSAELLGRFIQNDVNGHDSQEDAVAAMELMFYKIKDDMKKLI